MWGREKKEAENERGVEGRREQVRERNREMRSCDRVRKREEKKVE